MKTSISRRGMLSAGTAGFLVLPSRVLGRGPGPAPNDKLNIAYIGIGNYGARAIQELTSHNTVALCDVDWRPPAPPANPPSGARRFTPPPTASEIAHNYPGAKRFDDWRAMLQEMGKQIDAVVVSTADHTHAVAAIAAMKMGKPVFCEKPLAHTVGEVRAMMAAERKYKVATQTGVQGHASEDCRSLVEWVRDGAIGDVKEVHLFQPPGFFNGPDYYKGLQHIHDDEAIPPEVKWDLWLGPAPERPYNPMYLRGRWRSWVDFGTGILGDHGPHYLDPVYWALELGYPETIEAETDAEFDPHGQMFPRMSIVRYQFPARGSKPAVAMTWHGFHLPPVPKGWPADKPLPEGGGIMIGSKGIIVFGPMYMSRPGQPLPGQVTLLPAELDKEYKRPPKTLPRVQSHWLEWADAAKAGRQASADFEYGGAITEICLLGDIAIRNKGTLLRFDSAKHKFQNSDSANRMMETANRKGWALPS